LSRGFREKHSASKNVADEVKVGGAKLGSGQRKIAACAEMFCAWLETPAPAVNNDAGRIGRLKSTPVGQFKRKLQSKPGTILRLRYLSLLCKKI
jgi:hypothetical protein